MAYQWAALGQRVVSFELSIGRELAVLAVIAAVVASWAAWAVH